MRWPPLLLAVAACSDRALPLSAQDGFASGAPDLAAPDLASPPLDTAARACITAAGCDLSSRFPFLDFGHSVSACLLGLGDIENPIVQLEKHIDAGVLACLAAGGSDCIAIGDCIQALGPSCPAKTEGWSKCQGNVLNQCSGPVYLPFDCAMIGMSCVQFPVDGAGDYNGVCSFGNCDHAGDLRCFGSLLATCTQQATGSSPVWTLKEDCSRYPGVCGSDQGTAACRGTGPNCSGSSSCDGTTAVSCLGGASVRVDCGVQNETCAAGVCVMPRACAPHCDGDVLVTCGPKGEVRVDCAALGLGSCDVSAGVDRCR